MNISLKVTGPILKKMIKASAEARDLARSGLRDISTFYLQRSIETAPKGIGALGQSMRRELDENALKASIFPTVQYGFYVHGNGENGSTQPHWIPAREAKPGGSLYRWAQKKGANPWAVRAGIAKRGTKFQPWLKELSENEPDEAKRIMTDTINKIANFLKD